jgi:hypothetical protein
VTLTPLTLHLGGRELSAFRFCGLVGFAIACAVALGTTARTGGSIRVESALVAAAVATFLLLALATKVVTGREALIYYHHEIAVLAMTGVAAWGLGAPVLRHLDATALGLGVFLCAGRVGCFLAGCCHGRPARRGVCYGRQYAAAGLPSYLVGERLVPVQLVEAVVVLVLVLAGGILATGVPGEAFGLYVTGYALARFVLEVVRGDTLRPYWHGLSEAQWTSLAIVCGMSAAAVSGLLPGAPAHLGAALVLLVLAPIVSSGAVRLGRDLLDAQHVRELAHVLPPLRSGRPTVTPTSLGIHISAGVARGVGHYTLSRSPEPLVKADAQRLARVLLWLRPSRGQIELVPGAAGAFHVVLAPAQTRPAGLAGVIDE